MPAYDYRCKQCGREFSLFYKSYRDYDAAEKRCPHCSSADLSRLIHQINVANPSSARNYTQMSSNEMLSVLESGDSRAVGEMFKQVGDSAGGSNVGADYQHATERLLKGDSMEKVEKDLRSSTTNE